MGALGEIVGLGRPRTRPNRTQTCLPEPLQMEPGRQLEAGLAGGWDGTACLPGSLRHSRWGPVCLSRALSLRRAAERLVLPPSLSSVRTQSPWFTQHRGCVLGRGLQGPCRGGAGGHEVIVSSANSPRVTSFTFRGRLGGQAQTLGTSASSVLNSCPREGRGSERAQFHGSPRGPQTDNAIPKSSYSFSKASLLHVLHNFLF